MVVSSLADVNIAVQLGRHCPLSSPGFADRPNVRRTHEIMYCLVEGIGSDRYRSRLWLRLCERPRHYALLALTVPLGEDHRIARRAMVDRHG
jgi:hypothetical protein